MTFPFHTGLDFHGLTVVAVDLEIGAGTATFKRMTAQRRSGTPYMHQIPPGNTRKKPIIPCTLQDEDKRRYIIAEVNVAMSATSVAVRCDVAFANMFQLRGDVPVLAVWCLAFFFLAVSMCPLQSITTRG
jgi:hypothetical protein